MAAERFVFMAKRIYGIAHQARNRKYKIEAIADYLECEQCAECIEANKLANSDATTPGFFYRTCMKHREAAAHFQK
jgi:hypothetical protein